MRVNFRHHGIKNFTTFFLFKLVLPVLIFKYKNHTHILKRMVGTWVINHNSRIKWLWILLLWAISILYTLSIKPATHDIPSVIYLCCVICRLLHINEIYYVYTLKSWWRVYLVVILKKKELCSLTRLLIIWSNKILFLINYHKLIDPITPHNIFIKLFINQIWNELINKK